MNIQEIMSKSVACCKLNDTLNAAANLMWENDCGAIPVIDDSGELVGMITDRDICMAVYIQGSPLSDISISNAMSREAFSCNAEASLESALRLMGDKQVHRIPVVDDKKRPIGILSLGDIVRHVVSSRRRDGLDQAAMQTLAAICQPRRPAPTVRNAPMATERQATSP